MFREIRLFIVTGVLALAALIEYYRSLLFYSRGGDYTKCSCFQNDSHAKVHTYCLGIVLYKWNDKGLNGNTIRDHLRQHLGSLTLYKCIIPMKFWLYSKWSYYIFLFLVYPLFCIINALTEKKVRGFAEVPSTFQIKLINPSHWVTLGWTNAVCSFFSLQELPASVSSLFKQTRLIEAAKECNIPVIEKLDGEIVIKNANVEGGMGIKFFNTNSKDKNYVIQKVFDLHKSLKDIVPKEYHFPPPRFHITTMYTMKAQSEGTYVLSSVLELINPKTSNSYFFDIDIFSQTIDSAYFKTDWYSSKKRGKKEDIPKLIVNAKRTSVSTLSELEDIFHLAVHAHEELFDSFPCAIWEIQLTSKGPILENVTPQTNHWSSSQVLNIYQSWHSHFQHNELLNIQ